MSNYCDQTVNCECDDCQVFEKFKSISVSRSIENKKELKKIINKPLKIINKKIPINPNKPIIYNPIKLQEPIEYKEIKKYVFEEKRNILLHSMGGTGKSQALLCIKRDCEQQGIICHTTSTTGISSFNIRGQTIHRFSGIGIGDKSLISTIKKISKNKDCIKRLKDTQILILDEISMLGVKTFDLISGVLKHFRQNKLPFGGVQLVLTGDVLQLQPIGDDFCFESDLWEKLNLKKIKMKRPYRYMSSDPTKRKQNLKHFEMLKRLRLGTQTKEDEKVLQTRVKAYKEYEKVIEDPAKYMHEKTRINKSICKIIENYVDYEGELKPTRLYSTRFNTDQFNKEELGKLKTIQHTFIAVDSAIDMRTGDIIDDEDLIERNKPYMDTFISPKIELKEKAQVILTKNIDVDRGLTNGARGVIINISYGETKQPIVKVLFKHGLTEDITINEFKQEDGKIEFIRRQIPLILGFATTIHKAQGLSMDYAIIDLGYSLFQEALGYVAISRVRELEGILISKLMISKIRANKRAIEFEESIEDD